MFEYQRISNTIFIHRSPKQLFQEVKEALSSMDNSAGLRVEALKKAIETPGITDVTSERPTGPGSGQVGHHANHLFLCTVKKLAFFPGPPLVVQELGPQIKNRAGLRLPDPRGAVLQ